jgi:hypothetical protein
MVAVYSANQEEEESACVYTPEREVGYVPPPPPPPPMLTCFDYDQRAGVQNYPCPPGGLLLRLDAVTAGFIYNFRVLLARASLPPRQDLENLSGSCHAD